MAARQVSPDSSRILREESGLEGAVRPHRGGESGLDRDGVRVVRMDDVVCTILHREDKNDGVCLSSVG